MLQARDGIYWAGLMGCAALAGLWFWLRGRRGGMSPASLGLSLGLGAALGLMGAKLLYLAVCGGYLLPTYGWQVLLRLKGNEFAMCGGVFGVLAGIWLAGRLTGVRFSTLLDGLAPAGLLLIAGSRFCEYFADFGLGRYVEAAAWQFFPYAVMNEYGEWYQAVFLLEGLLAALALWTVLRLGSAWPAGRLALILWALPQIFSESLRNEALRLGFVRVQQAACALIALGCMLPLSKADKRPRRLLGTFGLFFLGIGLCVGVEFALDKSDIPAPICYGAMLLALAGMGAAALAGLPRQMHGKGGMQHESQTGLEGNA